MRHVNTLLSRASMLAHRRGNAMSDLLARYDAGEEPERGVGRLDEAVGPARVQSGHDDASVGDERRLEFDEG